MSQDTYHSHYLSQAAVIALLTPSNPFGAFEDFDAAGPVAVCRSMPITEAVRAADARLMAERSRLNVSPAQAWRDKAQLDPANVRTVRHGKTADGRQPQTRNFAMLAVREAKICVACKAEMPRNIKTEMCVACRPKKVWQNDRAMKACAAGCGRQMEVRSSYDVCHRCRAGAKLTKQCLSCPAMLNQASAYVRCKPCRMGGAMSKVKCGRDGCECAVLRSRAGELCWRCKARSTSKASPVPRVLCESGCGRLLRRGREVGLCSRCGDSARPPEYNRQRVRAAAARRNLLANNRCSVCGVLIKWRTKTGMCGKHAPRISKRTAMVAV